MKINVVLSFRNQKMAAAQKHVLRVYVARDTALKLTLLERPKSVEELKEIMQERFKPRLDGTLACTMKIRTLMVIFVFLWTSRSY